MEATYLSPAVFFVAGSKLNEFTLNRRVRLDCGVDGIFYASIVSSTLNGGNTEISIDENVLTNNLTDVYYSVISPGQNGGLPNHTHDNNEGEGGNIYSKMKELIFFLGG